MKYVIIALLTLFSVSLPAQGIYSQSEKQDQREQDLLNFIKSDIDLYKHYQSGKKNLSVAKGFGYTSLGLLGGGGALFALGINQGGWDGFGCLILGFLSITTGAALGTIGTIIHFRGKGKVRDVMDYARGEIGESYGIEFNLKATDNSIGLVVNF